MTPTCYRPDGTLTRLLVGRHDESCDQDRCHGCAPCTEPHCRSCRRTHTEPDQPICPGCLALVRVDVHAIGTLAKRLPAEAVMGRPAFHIHTGVPGGEALILMAPGHHDPRLPTIDPRPPTVVLDFWVMHWAVVLGIDPTPYADTDLAVAHLDQHLHQTTGDLGFLAMAEDLAKTVRRLEDVLHDGERPERSRVPCWECGTRLVKVYASVVKDDHWLCPRCGETYDAGRYERAKHDHLASSGANRYVSVADATVAIGRPVQTVRSWIRRDLVDTIRHPRTGRLVVWWPDIRNLHLSTTTRSRRVVDG